MTDVVIYGATACGVMAAAAAQTLQDDLRETGQVLSL